MNVSQIIMPLTPIYSQDPHDPKQFTRRFDKFYTRFAPLYNVLVKALPVWRKWLEQTLPQLRGPRILEVSFGTGHLLTRYAHAGVEVHGVDLNARMVALTRGTLNKQHKQATLLQADVFNLPYASESMDSVVNTMAFSGYPDGHAALKELARVLKRSGRQVMLDINYPRDRNWLGMLLARAWMASGDLIPHMGQLFADCGLAYEEQETGGSGSVHLYVAEKK
jgi:ubiquinone/menaquinone biosynthesis C-methylase UbiE